jgi:3'-5' exoribonuclease
VAANKWAVGDYVTGTFVVASIEQKQGKGGGPFLVGKLQNKNGVIPFKRWNATLDDDGTSAGGVSKGNVVDVNAKVDAYEGVTQLIVQDWQVALDTSYSEADLIPHSPIESDVLWSEMLSHIERIGDAGLREWLSAFVADREKAIRMAPAAIAMHHAYAGGLMEHINGLCRAAEQIGLVYDVDLDVLIAGCVLHDIGKIFELQAFPALDYTAIGNLVGHICIGIAEVSKSMLAWNNHRTAWDGVNEPVAKHIRYHIMHIIASHHGLAEHGAARPPATLEAIIFHHLDMIDSRAWMFAQHVAADQSDGEFTNFHRGLEARLWKRAVGREVGANADQ